MPDLADRLRRAIDAVPAVTVDDAIAKHTSRTRRTRLQMITVAAAIAVSAAVAAAAVGSGSAATKVRITSAPSANPPSANQVPLDSPVSSATAHHVTTTIALARLRTPPGTPIGGRLTVDNRTGRPLTAGAACPSLAFQVSLRNGHASTSEGFLSVGCHPAFTFPTGTSSWPFSIATTYETQSGRLPLPDGFYQTAFLALGFFQLPVPPPRTVIVAPLSPGAAPPDANAVPGGAGAPGAVPDEVGEGDRTAADDLVRQHWAVIPGSVASSTIPAGTVVFQSPTAGSQPTDPTVTLFVSTGPPTPSSVHGSTPTATGSSSPLIVVPNVIGLDQVAAVNQLGALGLETAVTYGAGNPIKPGQTLTQSPPAGTTVKLGTTVSIRVAGPAIPAGVPATTS